MATPNWTELECNAKHLTTEQLKFALKDCLAAAEARQPDHPASSPCKGENYYRDEASVYSGELRRRESKQTKRK